MTTYPRSNVVLAALAGLCAVLVFLVSFRAGNSSAAEAPVEPSGEQPGSSALDLLRDQAGVPTPGVDTTVRVIVEVAAAKPASAESVQEYRTRVASVQDRVVQRLDGRFVEKARLQNLPFMVLEVDRTSLVALQASDEVVNVYEDRKERPSLLVSVGQVGGDRLVTQGFDGSGFSVAILDTGVDTSHPAFAGRIVAEACFSSTYADQTVSLCPNGQDEQIGPGAGINCPAAVYGCDHGTHVAGIAAGRSANGNGVAPGAGIIAVQVFSRNGEGCPNGYEYCAITWSSDQVRALDWIYSVQAEHRVAAVNMSLGGGRYTDEASCDAGEASRKRAIDQLLSAGVITVIASGNESMTDGTGAPACISSAVAVGAVDSSDTVTDFSNSAAFVDLLAPGYEINAAVPGGGYDAKSGTSMATPHVAGAITLLRAAAPTASGPDVVAALRSTGVRITDARNGVTVPRIQLDAAYASLTGQVVSPAPNPNPAPQPNPQPQPQPSPAGVANDEWYEATLIDSYYFAEITDTTTATEGDDPYLYSTAWCEWEGYAVYTTWYAFTAPADGWFWASTFGSDFDTVLAVFDGDAQDWIQLGCVDDDYYPYNLGSTISGWVPAGATILIQASGTISGGTLAFQAAFTPDGGWGYSTESGFEAASALRP